MTWGEAIALTEVLAKDPSSWVHAALAGWEHPVSREWLVLTDLFDQYMKSHFKKPERYPRPWPDSGPREERFGEPIAPADIADVLRAFGRDPAALN